MKRIVVEGPDFSGKTTYINNALAKMSDEDTYALYTSVIKQPQPVTLDETVYDTAVDPNLVERMQPLLTDDVNLQMMYMFAMHSNGAMFTDWLWENGFTTVFQDRGMLSTWVYQHEIMSKLNTESLLALWKVCTPQNIEENHMVVLLPAWDIIQQRQKKTREANDELSFFENALHERYNLYIQSFADRTKYTTTQGNPCTLLELLVEREIFDSITVMVYEMNGHVYNWVIE